MMQDLISSDEYKVAVKPLADGETAHTDGVCELEILTEGEAELLINDRKITAKEGAFWLSFPGGLRREVKKGGEMRVLSVKFSGDLLSENINSLLQMYPSAVIGELEKEELSELIKMCYRLSELFGSANSKLCKNLLAKSVITAILALLLDKSDGFLVETGGKMTESGILEAVGYIKKHYTDNLTASGMAKRMGYTPNYFSMKFKSLTGKNFIDAVNDERLGAAYRMLTATDISITAVSEYVGYSSVAYFSRIFKKKFKKTPREVKNGSKMPKF